MFRYQIYTLFFSLMPLLMLANDSIPLNEKKDSEYYFTGGFGYYTDIGGMGFFEHMESVYNGSTAWFEAGKLMKNGFNVGARVAHGSTTMTMDSNWGIFEGQLKPSTFLTFAFIVSRPFKFGRNHEFNIGTGIMIQSEHYLSPSIYTVNYITYVNLGSHKMLDLALDISLAYGYKFDNNFFIGFRASSAYVFAIGMSGLTLSPTIGVKF